MADTYRYLGGQPNIEVLPGGQAHDVVISSFVTLPSEVPFVLAIDTKDLTTARLKLIVPTVAEALERANAEPGVVNLQVFLNVNAAGQFVRELQADVESTSGNTSATIHPAYGSIFGSEFADAVAAQRAHLDAVEGD